MAYLFLISALLFMSIKGYCGKKTSGYIESGTDSMLFNFLRMLLCIVIGLIVVLAERASAELAVEAPMLWITVGAAAANTAFLACWMLAVQRAPMVTVDVALIVGSILPAVLCFFLFGEAISLWKMLGFAMILLATAVLAGYSKDTGKKAGLMGVILILMATLGEGLSGFFQQLYKQFYTASGTRHHGVFYAKSVYHFYTYVFSALLLSVLFVLFALRGYRHACTKGEKQTGRQYACQTLARCKKPILYIVVMAVCLFAASYFQTVATNDYGMKSQVLYPVTKGGCLIAANITAMLFFGEKANRRSVLGSLIALVGIILMSIL